MSKIKVLFVASECAPLAKVGGLGDVIGSLPKALAKLGVEVKIVLPFYEAINRKIWQPKFLFNLDSKTSVWKTKLPKSQVEVLLIYNKKHLSTGSVYFEKTAFAGSKKEIDRFVFFSQAVFRLLAPTYADFTQTSAEGNSAKSAFSPRESAMSGWRPDIVHCNDWHTGFLAKLLKSRHSDSPRLRGGEESQRDPSSANKRIQDDLPRVIFTIHNLANQGVYKDKNLMAEGIKNADVVTTVSPTYAKEILTKEYGAGLENLLRERRKDLVGILNGVDYDFWPKKHARWDNIPTFGLVSRLTYQKGIDLAVSLAEEFIKKYNAQFWFLGQGEAQYEKALQGLAKKYPRNVFVKIGFDEKLARQIYRESDFFLMPSRFEPSGLGQMISMHYGTVPIVRATGGLKDSVKHLKTGFVFKKESVIDLRKAMELAVKYFYDKKKFDAIRKDCLAENFSWEKSALEYKKLYQRLLP